jgi:hypothetical protein
MDEAERPTAAFLRARGGMGARGIAEALKAVYAEMFPEVLGSAAELPEHAEPAATSGSDDHVHGWCIVGERDRAPAWVTCRCGLSVPGRDWRTVDFEAWAQYVDPNGLQRAFMDVCGLEIVRP